MVRTLRLTNAVAYNAFNTTPVITQVGSPVSRTSGGAAAIHVKTGQQMLDIERSGLLAVAQPLPESGGLFPAGGSRVG